MTQIIQAQPDDSSYDEILKELLFALMVERGLQDSLVGRTISNEEMKRDSDSAVWTLPDCVSHQTG